ncbi:putative arsenate reductase [Prochlorococcus sp. MIT 0601]|nr:putative arsenate reductase [Prochlorococcus sp. MIT 0601]
MKWLNDNKIEYELLDITKEVPSKELILSAIEQLGDRKYLFNTSGKSYRSLGSNVVKAMTKDESLKALCNDGKLIKRPFLVDSNKHILIGFNELKWSDHFLR